MADQSVGSMPSRFETGVFGDRNSCRNAHRPAEVARADRFSDEVYGNDLRRVENFSTSQSRYDSLLRMTDLASIASPSTNRLTSSAKPFAVSYLRVRYFECLHNDPVEVAT